MQIGQFILGKNLGIGAFGKVGRLDCTKIASTCRVVTPTVDTNMAKFLDVT